MVDGVDVRLLKFVRDWHSHKFKKSAVRYEIAVSDLGGVTVCSVGLTSLDNYMEILGYLCTFLKDL